MFRRLALLLCLWPMSGQAACPTRADLEQGIVLVQNAPHFRRADFRTTLFGLHEDRLNRIGGGVGRSVTLYRHGLIPIEQSSRNGTLRLTYRGDLRALDRLDGLGQVTLTGQAHDAQDRPLAFSLRLSLVAHRVVTLGNCRYPVWHLHQRKSVEGRAPVVFELDYSPELGLILSATRRTIDGKAIADFAYGWIGTSSDVRR